VRPVASSPLLDAGRGGKFGAASADIDDRIGLRDQAGRDARKSSTALLEASGLPWFIGCEVPGMVTRWTSLMQRYNASRMHA
jgi:hypothetical protein